MSVELFNGIGFGRGSKSGAAFITFTGIKKSAAFTSPSKETDDPANTKPASDTIESFEYARHGDDNALPIAMVKHIEHCGVLCSGIDGKARFGLGRGPKPFIVAETKPDGSEVLTPVDDPAINDWMEENNIFSSAFGWFKDQIAFHHYCARFKFTRDGSKIGLCWRHDVSELRYQRKNDNGIIKNVFLSAQWDRVSGDVGKDKRVVTIPLLPAFGPAQFLLDIDPSKRKNKEFVLTGKTPGWNRHYYPIPNWMSAEDWVDICEAVPKMKAAIFENNIRVKYIVKVHEGYWKRTHKDWETFDEVNKKKKIQDLWDKIDEYLAGAENAGKSIFVTSYVDPITKVPIQDIDIQVVADSTKQGEYLPDGAAGNSEILFSIMMNPALMGADSPGGPYGSGAGSGSNIREAGEIQITIQEPERHEITRILNIVKKVNKWDPKIVWRFPAHVLTTLDKEKTGKKETINGG